MPAPEPAPGLLAPHTPGWFGKLAMLGDFASRRLDAGWVQGCDAWFSAGLRASQRALGEGWLAAYLAAPVWRFAWGPGVVDAQWWFGVWLPRCDNVGRYYPLLLALPRSAPPADRVGLDHLELWCKHLAHAGLATLADGATLAAFEAALAQAPPWPGSGRKPWLRALPDPTLATPAAPARERYEVAAGAGLSDAVLSLAAQALSQRLAGASVWWPMVVPATRGAPGTPGTPATPGSCTVVTGLPGPEAFKLMLLRQW